MEYFRESVLKCIVDINKRIEHTTKACDGECSKDISDVMKNYPDIKFESYVTDELYYNFKISHIIFSLNGFDAFATTWLISPYEVIEGNLYDGKQDDKTTFYKLRFFLKGIYFEDSEGNCTYYAEDLTHLCTAPL